MRSVTITSTIVLLAVAAALVGVRSAQGVDIVNNGFHSDQILVLVAGTCESDIRILDETRLDGPPPYVDGMDLGRFGPPKAISSPYTDAIGSHDSSRIKSLCFSNSPVPGTYTPAGARLFGLYEVRSAEGPVGPVENEPPEYDWTNYSSSFQIVELDNTGKRIRVMAVGLAASLFHDLPAPFDICNNHSPDLLIAPWCSNDQWGEGTRHNVNGGVRIGNIRYNAAKNTLMVSAIVGEWLIFTQNSPLTGEPAYPRGRVYEFELPDWPETYYQSEAEVPYYCTNKAQMVGEPIPVSDPALVRLVQIYEMPGNVSANNGQTQNDNTRPAIDIDGQGNVYFTSVFYNATTPPNFSGTSLGTCWNGSGLWHGDVIKFNSLGHRAGRDKYVVPVTGPDACNVVISAQNQDAMGHTQYAGGHGIAVRPGNQLATVPRITCNDASVDPNFKYVNIFDLTQTEGGAYPCDLRRLKYLGNDRCDLPRLAYFAQRDMVSGRVYMANLMGACDCAQNFMCIQPDDTVAHDLGYHLTSSCQYASCAGHYEQGVGCELRSSWDAASSPGESDDPLGACCNPFNNTCSDNVKQTICYGGGGWWQGKNTVCGQFPCPGQGACCRPCGIGCTIAYQSECNAWDSTWHGVGTTCGQVVCDACSPQPMDSDCDGDVDQADFAAFQVCFNPGVGTPVECACFDKASVPPESENAIDTFDLALFELCASGPGVSGDQACAGTP
jgi:hypothetical protein